jgi:hypothetical protein
MRPPTPAPRPTPSNKAKPKPPAEVAATGEPLAFRVSMFCVAPTYEPQSADFLESAFDAFPDKDFCILTLPPQSSELPLARLAMTRVASYSADAPDALHMCHRAGTLPAFKVRRAVKGVGRCRLTLPKSVLIESTNGFSA